MPAGYRILLIEDNPGDRRLIQEMLLETQGHPHIRQSMVTAVSTLQDGLHHLQNTTFDVILLDLSLPDSSGHLNTFYAVYHDSPNIPIVVLTGFGDHDLAKQAIKHGAQDYLTKNRLDAELLARAISYGIERHTLTHDLRQKHAELQASEYRRQAMLENSVDGIILITATGTISYANPVARHLFCPPNQTLVGTQWHFNQTPGTIDQIEVVRNDGEFAILEMRLDETEWQGEHMLMAHLRDITLQKQAEMARQESDERLRSTLSSMDDLVFILDKNGRFQSYSHPHHPSISRIIPTFIIGKSYKDILPATVTSLLSPAIEAIKSSNWVQQFDYALHSATHNNWFSAKVSARRDASGNFAGATVVIRDITKLKEAEQHLQARNAQLDSLRKLGLEISLELSREDLLQTLTHRAIDLLSARGCTLFLLDTHQNTLIPAASAGANPIPQNRELIQGADLPERVWQSRQPIHIQNYKHPATPAQKLNIHDQADMIGVPVRWQQTFLGVLVVVSHYGTHFSQDDINMTDLLSHQIAVTIQNNKLHTQLQTYNEELAHAVALQTSELRLAYDKLKSLDTLKSKFMADVSHELRTPITNLNLYLTLLTLGSIDKHTHYIEVLKQEVTRLELLLESILQLSELDSAKIDRQFHPLALDAIIENALHAIRPLVHNKGLKLQVNLPNSQLQVIGSKHHLTQALHKIMRNAVSYTNAGEIEVSVTVAKEIIALAICDTGIGIPADELTHIFDRFYRGKQVSQSTTPGLGLGLSIAKAIIEMHQGTITIESELGRGTRVLITLPLAKNK